MDTGAVDGADDFTPPYGILPPVPDRDTVSPTSIRPFGSTYRTDLALCVANLVRGDITCHTIGGELTLRVRYCPRSRLL